MGLLCFLQKKRTKSYFFLKKTRTPGLSKKQVDWRFLKKNGFFSTLVQTLKVIFLFCFVAYVSSNYSDRLPRGNVFTHIT